jgi:hypothetical protein
LYHYLKNSVESCLEFFPNDDLLILDNNSTNPKILDYLKTIHLKYPNVKVIFRGSNTTARKVGSLYEAYNEAIEIAIAQSYDVVNLMNDDIQVMHRDPNFLTNMKNIWAQDPNITNISVMFSRKLNPDVAKQRVLHASGLGYLPNLYGVSDEGFFQVSFFAKTGFRFMNTETEHSTHMWNKGFRTLSYRDPFISFIPWPATRRKGRTIGVETPPIERFYLKPISTHLFSKLVARPLSEIPFAEDYCFPWNYSCLTPYCPTTPGLEYVQMSWKRRKLPFYETRGQEYGQRRWPAFLKIILAHREPSILFFISRCLREIAYKIISPIISLKQ